MNVSFFVGATSSTPVAFQTAAHSRRPTPGVSFAARPISETQSMELSSLTRLTHSRHFDTVKHGAEGLAVPAGLILALATSLSARDLHEVREKRRRPCWR